MLYSVLFYLVTFAHVSSAKEPVSDIVKFAKSIAKSSAFKVLEKVAGFWSPADTIIRLFIGAIETEPEDPLIPVKEKLDEMSVKIDDLSRQIETSTLSILSEINTVELKRIEATINSAPSKLKTMIEESGNDKTMFRKKLEQFMESFTYPINMEYQMVQYLTTGGRASASPISRFSDLVKNNAKEHFYPLKSSPNVMVFEFHVSIMHSVFKLTNLLAACNRTIDYIQGSKIVTCLCLHIFLN